MDIKDALMIHDDFDQEAASTTPNPIDHHGLTTNDILNI